jgi:tetratricopeptide (TPR) repeat protein
MKIAENTLKLMPRKLTTVYFILAVFLFSVMLLGIQRINYVKRIKSARSYVNLGNASFVNSNFDNAISDYNEALLLNPKDAMAYLQRGLAYIMKMDLDKAIDNFSESIHLNPKGATAYFERGSLYDTKGEYCVATLGAAYAETGDFENAVKYQKQALSMFGATEKNQNDEQQRLDLYEQNKPYHEVLKTAPPSIAPSVSP